MTPPTYTIHTVHDFRQIPEASREVCLREFLTWLAMMDQIPAMVGVPLQLPEAYEWIDDGMHTAEVSISDGTETIEVISGVLRGFAVLDAKDAEIARLRAELTELRTLCGSAFRKIGDLLLDGVVVKEEERPGVRAQGR